MDHHELGFRSGRVVDSHTSRMIAAALFRIDGAGGVDIVLDVAFDRVVAGDLFEAALPPQSGRLADPWISVEIVDPRDGLGVWVWMLGHRSNSC